MRWPFWGTWGHGRSRAIPLDYDEDPERFRAGVEAAERYNVARDVHEGVAGVLARANLTPVLDVGCGEGRLVRPLLARGLAVIAMDYSATMLKAVPGHRVEGDARRLPFPDQSFGGVAALYMLYHLEEPRQAIAEAYRVLRPGGLFVASAPSRHNDPELAEVLALSGASTFDAENGPELVGELFSAVQVERWDAPLVRLPDHEALRLYLRGRQLAQPEIEKAISRVKLPLTLTKRGALIYARRTD